MITTPDLQLMPATVAHARAEIADRDELSRLLQAEVPENWPPESSADALPVFLHWLEAKPDCIGWFGWYALIAGKTSKKRVLAGSGGFLGPPENGEVGMGYSVLPQFQGLGLATQIVSGLIGWAREQRSVIRILAETEWENPASVRVLEKNGFIDTGPPDSLGGRHFELGLAFETLSRA